LKATKQWVALLMLSTSLIAGCSSEPANQSTPAPAKNTNQTTEQTSAKPPADSPKVRAALARTVIPGEDGAMEVTNMLDTLVVVNKQRNLKSDYEPPDLVQPNIPFSFEGKSPKKLMRKEAARALEKLFAQAKQENIDLVGQSAYRDYKTQKAIFNRLIKKYGSPEEANKVSAHPGQSEHQTGLAIDVTSKRVGYTLEQNFGETPEGKWLAANAPKHGFIIRYPKGKEDVTGYSYEPWHIRYVGKEVAEEIARKNITLEEYLSQ
jgi:D-alanyl-D-alanine carboxypeptidase